MFILDNGLFINTSIGNLKFFDSSKLQVPTHFLTSISRKRLF